MTHGSGYRVLVRGYPRLLRLQMSLSRAYIITPFPFSKDSRLLQGEGLLWLESQLPHASLSKNPRDSVSKHNKSSGMRTETQPIWGPIIHAIGYAGQGYDDREH